MRFSPDLARYSKEDGGALSSPERSWNRPKHNASSLSTLDIERQRISCICLTRGAVPREEGPRKWSGGARGFVARPRKLRAQRI
jgi:hypothetical protein